MTSCLVDRLGKSVQLLLGQRVGVLRGRVLPALHLIPIRLDSLQGLGPDIAVLLDELREESSRGEVADHVDLDEYLAGAAAPRADADGGDRQLLGDYPGYLLGDGLEDHGVASGFLDGEGILEDLHSPVRRLALDPEAAEGILPLRGQADVAEHGDASLSDLPDRGGHLFAALYLDALHAPFLDEPDGGLQSLFRRDFIRPHWKISDLRGEVSIVCYRGGMVV